MAGLNKVQIIGHLGRDPEMRFTPQGSPVTSFSVAVSRKWGSSGGSKNEETIWFRVETWERLAETCNQYLTKGMQVFIEGRLKPPRVYTDRNGTARCEPEIVASTMLMLGGRGEGASDYTGNEDAYSEHNDTAPAPARPTAPAPARPAGNSDATRNQPETILEDEDEIPF